MARKIAVGTEDFAVLRKAGSYYVDKTELIYDLVANHENAVTLFTRPRRFGKTLTMSMLEHFFAVDKKREDGLFDGLAITEHAGFCAKYMNAYPVLFLSLKDVEGRTYEDAYENEDNLWSALLMAGYVTTAFREEAADPDEEIETEAELRIPNREIAGIFRKAVVDHFRKSIDPTKIRELMDSLWKGDTVTATGILSDLLWNTISYNDYKEDYYHAFLAGIFVGRGRYIVESNKEKGLGRPDIVVQDVPNRRAIIIEAKRSESKKQMENCCEDAIDQIVREGYAQGMDGYKEILCYGVSFYKKDALVMKMESRSGRL